MEKSGEAGSSQGKKHSEKEGWGLISWPQVLSFLLRLEEKPLQPEFSLVDAWLFFAPEARHSAGMSAPHEEAPETALGALIRGWEQGKLPSSLSDSDTAGRSSESSSETAKKRNSSARLQDLAFESVGMRKV